MKGEKKMIEMNIPKMSEQKKNRDKQTTAFFLKVHDIVTNSETTIES